MYKVIPKSNTIAVKEIVYIENKASKARFRSV